MQTLRFRMFAQTQKRSEYPWKKNHVETSYTCRKSCRQTLVNPVSPNSDQQQISPNDIHTFS